MNDEDLNNQTMIVYGNMETDAGKIYRDVTLSAGSLAVGFTANDGAVSVEVLDRNTGDGLTFGLDSGVFWAMIALLAGAEAEDVANSEDPPPVLIIRSDQNISEEEVQEAAEDIAAMLSLVEASREFEDAIARREQEGNQ